MIDYSVLHGDIQADAGRLAAGSALLAGTGYATMAALVAAGEDTLIAALYNGVSSGNSIALTTANKDDVIHAISSELAALIGDIGGGVSKAVKYGPLLQMLQMLSVVDFTNSYLQGQFTALVADGYLTSGLIAGMTTRAGSRGEVLFGAGAVVTAMDVARAFGRGF